MINWKSKNLLKALDKKYKRCLICNHELIFDKDNDFISCPNHIGNNYDGYSFYFEVLITNNRKLKNFKSIWFNGRIPDGHKIICDLSKDFFTLHFAEKNKIFSSTKIEITFKTDNKIEEMVGLLKDNNKIKLYQVMQ
jgi:hypothetical protein